MYLEMYLEKFVIRGSYWPWLEEVTKISCMNGDVGVCSVRWRWLFSYNRGAESGLMVGAWLVDNANSIDMYDLLGRFLFANLTLRW